MPRLTRLFVPVAVLAMVLYFTPVGKHAAVIYDKIVGKIDKQIPIRHKIDLLKQDVRDLDKDIDSKITEVATCRVAEKEAREQYETARAAVETGTEKLNECFGAIEAHRTLGSKAKAAQLKNEFATMHATFQAAEARMVEKEKQYKAAKETMKLATEELEALRGAKTGLEREVKELEDMLRSVERAEMQTRTPNGDNRVSEAQKKASELRHQLAVRAERMKMVAEPAMPASTPAGVEAEAALKMWKARQAAK